MRYIHFLEVLQLVTNAGWHFIILKRDVKNAFRNLSVAAQNQWLLGFRWGVEVLQGNVLVIRPSYTTFHLQSLCGVTLMDPHILPQMCAMSLLGQLCGHIQSGRLAWEIWARSQCLHLPDRSAEPTTKQFQGFPRDGGDSFWNRNRYIPVTKRQLEPLWKSSAKKRLASLTSSHSWDSSSSVLKLSGWAAFSWESSGISSITILAAGLSLRSGEFQLG